MMMPRNKILVAITIVFIAIGAGILVFHEDTQPVVNASQVMVPDGWTLYQTTPATIMLSGNQVKDAQYTDQISITVTELDRPQEEWIARYISDTTQKELETLGNYPTLQIERGAVPTSMTEETLLDYYVFKGDDVYIFSLYPLEYTNNAGKRVRSTANVELLKRIVSHYFKS